MSGTLQSERGVGPEKVQWWHGGDGRGPSSPGRRTTTSSTISSRYTSTDCATNYCCYDSSSTHTGCLKDLKGYTPVDPQTRGTECVPHQTPYGEYVPLHSVLLL